MNKLDPFDRHYLAYPELYAGTPQWDSARRSFEHGLRQLTRAKETAYAVAPPAEPGRYRLVPCPDCRNANRRARRACRKHGQCQGAGLVWMTVAENEDADIVIGPA